MVVLLGTAMNHMTVQVNPALAMLFEDGVCLVTLLYVLKDGARSFKRFQEDMSVLVLLCISGFGVVGSGSKQLLTLVRRANVRW